MGFFKKKSKKDKNLVDGTPMKKNKKSMMKGGDSAANHSPSTDTSESLSPRSSSYVNNNNMNQEPSIEMVPELIEDLSSASDPSGEIAARSLRLLFSLSEHSTSEKNRELMVKFQNHELVPCLLDFLQRCEPSSSEQYLALLVLNNISIPAENKRIIAIGCGGAFVLSRLLCEDPSCHLLAIILVNLTFADAELRRELVTKSSSSSSSSKESICLFEALSYALLISSSSPEEHTARSELMDESNIQNQNPRDLLMSAQNADLELQNNTNLPNKEDFLYRFDPARQIFPETAKWCLAALKNLTRPNSTHYEEDGMAQAMIESGIISRILRIVTVGDASSGYLDMVVCSNSEFLGNKADNLQVVPEENNRNNNHGDSINPPSTWEANAIQDAAMFTILNLASASSETREALRQEKAIEVLSLIADYSSMSTLQDNSNVNPAIAELQQQLQCLKARMALAYLVGSEGHFGQPTHTTDNTANNNNEHSNTMNSPNNTTDETVILVTNSEAEQLIELLSNTLLIKAKEGPGGYSAATFTVKGVLYAIRCLLTNHINQMTFVATGTRLNCLLLKAVAFFIGDFVPTVDAEAAEHACFSLYLLSTYGFKDSFLPRSYETVEEDDEKFPGAMEKIIVTFLSADNISPASRHAAQQLLMRVDHLKFRGSLENFAKFNNNTSFIEDYGLGEEILSILDGIHLTKCPAGTKPLPSIFGRPILRSRAPKAAEDAGPWKNKENVSIFPSGKNTKNMFHFLCLYSILVSSHNLTIPLSFTHTHSHSRSPTIILWQPQSKTHGTN